MNGRRHDIDALRAGAFALLILYHVGMVYVYDWDFHTKSPHLWEWLQWPMIAVNRWRMPLIFLISGIALGLSRAASQPLRMALRRSRMLLIPLIFGMLAIVPIQAWIEARENGAFDANITAFLARYWQLRPWPDGGFAGADFGVTWN
ncbi:MAG: acyltransferase family protein, partial [Pseudomonadota bacterium]